jgi:hypothetical protein
MNHSDSAQAPPATSSNGVMLCRRSAAAWSAIQLPTMRQRAGPGSEAEAGQIGTAPTTRSAGRTSAGRSPWAGGSEAGFRAPAGLLQPGLERIAHNLVPALVGMQAVLVEPVLRVHPVVQHPVHRVQAEVHPASPIGTSQMSSFQFACTSGISSR